MLINSKISVHRQCLVIKVYQTGKSYDSYVHGLA